MSKRVFIRYFALFRELSQKDEESLEVNFETYKELYKSLRDQYKWELPHTMVQIAINDEFSFLEKDIQDQDRVVFIPPVAGG